jgi:dUTP pyrophosphatase
MEKRVEIKVVKLDPAAKLPYYAHEGFSGDLCADLSSLKQYRVATGEVVRVQTGLALEFPPGYGALIQDRSGLASRGVFTTGGVIDVGYRGEIQVILMNLGPGEFAIAPGDRIAQIRIVERIVGSFIQAESLSISPRDQKGFGSTGS